MDKIGIRSAPLTSPIAAACRPAVGSSAAPMVADGYAGSAPVAPCAPRPAVATDADAAFDHQYSDRYPKNPALSTAFSLTPGAVTHVLYHANCPDGFGAALAAWETLGDRATYIPVTYGTPPPALPADAKVAIVDFSYPREQLLDLKSKVSDLVVLDHHESAQRHLEGLPFAYFPDTWPSKDGKGDPGHSGATLAWLYFHHDKPLPDLWLYLRDRDNWQWQLPHSKEVSTALASHPMDFRGWDNIAHHVDDLVTEGATIQRFKDQLIDKIVANTHMEDIDGHHVPVVNGPYELASDIADAMKNKYPNAEFVAVYYEDQNKGRSYSLRSTGFDVSKVAEKFGGGGHQQAAAFRIAAPGVDLEPKNG